MRFRGALAVAALVLAGVVPVEAADQTILGSRFAVKNPSTPDKRKVTVKAKEKPSPDTIVGDPTIGGATLTVRANGGTPSSETVSLPAGTSPLTGKPYWSGDATRGFRFKDARSENGVVKTLRIKRTSSGVFMIKAQLSGKVMPLSLVPPNPGTDACLLLEIAGGDSYSVRFAAGDGIVKNTGATQYQHKKVATQGTCVLPTTTTTSSSSTSSTPASTTTSLSSTSSTSVSTTSTSSTSTTTESSTTSTSTTTSTSATTPDTSTTSTSTTTTTSSTTSTSTTTSSSTSSTTSTSTSTSSTSSTSTSTTSTTSTSTSSTTSTTAAPTCSDGIKNGLETDVDCGGPTCPDCAFGKTCGVAGDCVTGHCSGGICKCASHLFTFTVNSNSGGVFDSAEWPGGSQSQTAATSCGVTIQNPNANIDLVCTLANPFAVTGFSGYSSCAGSGGEDGDGCQPVSCPPVGIGSCCATRPSCSAALNGSGSARYFVQCNE